MSPSQLLTSPVDSGYAWVRLVAAMLLTTVGCAGMYICMVSVTSYQTDFGVTRGQASLPFTMVMLGFGVGGILIGRFIDRFGIVKPLFVCALALGSSFWLAGHTENFWVFTALHAAIGAFGCAAVFSPLLADISKWFVQRRGLAIAICASGNYLAGTLWPPLMQYSIELSDWRTTYDWFGLLSVVGMLPLLLLLRRVPAATEDTILDGGSKGSPAALGLSTKALIGWLCFAGVGCCTAMAMPQAHVVALATDFGLTAADGARMLSLMFGFGVISRLFFGWISDRLGGLQTLLVSSTLQCIALAIFLPAQTASALYIAASLFGLFQGGIVPNYALIVREYFPVAKAGEFTGIVIFATLVGMAFGGWASGFVYDMTGSYDAAFLHGIAWNLANMAVIGFLVMRMRSNLIGANQQ